MKHILTSLIAVAFMAVALPVDAGPLPPLINFQSVLLDEGGNLLPSGATPVQFQILDENHNVIYTESQTVDVMKGAVSTLIGNGSDAKGLTTGGVPADIFATGAQRYLQVQVGTQVPEDPMTIVPVPYAQWSQTCASVAKAAVGFDQLAPDVVEKLAAEMSKSQGVVTAQSLGSNGGATQIGVEAKFINSGSSSVQGVLQDIDLSVKKRQEETTFLTGKLNQEVTNRTNEIKTINTTISDINKIPGTLSFDKVQTSTPPPSDLNMGGKKITNLGAPVSSTDASTKSYVDANDAAVAALFIKKDGSTGNVSGDISLNKHKITNLAYPSANEDAASKLYVDNTVKAQGEQNAPLVTAAHIKSGSYQSGKDNITIDVGFKPTAIKIFSVVNNEVDYFGVVTDATTITGRHTTSMPGKVSSIQLNGTSITIPPNGDNVNNLTGSGAAITYYYVIWGTS